MSLSLFQMKCRNCGADLSAEDGIESFYCMYCGTKIILDGQSNAALKAKTKIKIAEQKTKLHEKYYTHEERMADKKYEAFEKADKRNNRSIFHLFGLVLILMLIIVIIGTIGDKSRDKEIARLETILEEVKKDIRNEDYDSALIHANRLHFSGGRSEDQDVVDHWDTVRENVIEQIEAKRNGG